MPYISWLNLCIFKVLHCIMNTACFWALPLQKSLYEFEITFGKEKHRNESLPPTNLWEQLMSSWGLGSGICSAGRVLYRRKHLSVALMSSSWACKNKTIDQCYWRAGSVLRTWWGSLANGKKKIVSEHKYKLWRKLKYIISVDPIVCCWKEIRSL